MKILRYALLGLICLVPLTTLSSQYRNLTRYTREEPLTHPEPFKPKERGYYEHHVAPTNGCIGIGLFDCSKDVCQLIAHSGEALYFISGYIYNYGNNGELILRIPKIDGKNRKSYTKIKNWIEWIKETERIDVCENITTVPNKKSSRNKDALLTFKNAEILTDCKGFYIGIIY